MLPPAHLFPLLAQLNFIAFVNAGDLYKFFDMKLFNYFFLSIILIAISIPTKVPAQSVGINNDGSPPTASAMLDVKSTTKGMLSPRMTLVQRNAILSPATGLLVYQTDNNPGYYFYNGSVWTQLAAGGGSSYWSLNGNNIFNSNTGNVGIGTNTPVYPLTIQTPINTTGWVHIGGADSIIVGEAIGGVSAAIGTFSNHALRLNAGTGGGKMSIYPTGEIVVGDNNAGSFGKFSVQTLNNSYGISHLGEGGNILATRIGGTSAGIGTFSNTNMRIFANGVSAIFIGSGTNNVGIGIDFPTNKLEVNGTIRSKEVVVENVNWPDYVFNTQYKLTSLDSIRNFIEQNKHLPNIPSAAEVEKNGLHIGDTQKRMMEKIEELTLYMIEVNEQIKNSKEEIDALKDKIATLENDNLKK